tara:strand:- start:168 stop:671 length:504 start_codon:yes stop_codon:yes gene_type:complete
MVTVGDKQYFPAVMRDGLPYKYGPPRGKRRSDEDFEECGLRLLREQTGLELSMCPLLYQQYNGKNRTHILIYSICMERLLRLQPGPGICKASYFYHDINQLRWNSCTYRHEFVGIMAAVMTAYRTYMQTLEPNYLTVEDVTEVFDLEDLEDLPVLPDHMIPPNLLMY